MCVCVCVCVCVDESQPVLGVCHRLDVKLGGFDPSLKRLVCKATLKSHDTTKQSVYG